MTYSMLRSIKEMYLNEDPAIKRRKRPGEKECIYQGGHMDSNRVVVSGGTRPTFYKVLYTNRITCQGVN